MTVAAAAEFRVVDESDDWIVVDKAAPLLVHPTNRKPEPTLLDGLRALLAYELANGVRLSIVNRLDRETSGLVLVAKNRAAARRFGKRFAGREVGKQYLAVVRGWPRDDEWCVDAPLRRLGEVAPSPVWVRQCVHPAGRASFTRFLVERRVGHGARRFALVRCLPRTGRMHQIRVHLEHSGHPLVGDKIYGGDGAGYLEFIETGWSRHLEARLLLPRHALHAARLELADESGALAWEAPLPPDLGRFLDRAGAPLHRRPRPG